MKRRFGLASATALVVASMVGSGVFTTGGFLLEALESPWLVLLAWLAGGVIAGCGALSYGALARRFPESGGEYVFLSRTLHPAVGTIGGWISLLVGFSAPLAATTYGFGQYLEPWFPSLMPQATGTLLLCVLAVLHGWYGSTAARLQTLAVAINLLLIGAYVGLALPRLSAPAFEGAPPADFDIGSFFSSLVLVSFSYSGWNAAVYIGGEVRVPERNLLLALVLGTSVVTVLYLALNTAFVFSDVSAALAGRADIGRTAAQALGGPAWADFVTLLVAFVLSLSASAMMMAGPRVFARMAEDGFLPGWFGSTGTGTPGRATALQWGLSMIFLWSSGFRELLTYVGFTLGVSAAVTVCGLIRLRRREGRTFRVVGWPWIPSVFLFATGAMTVAVIIHRPLESLWGLVTIFAGWLFWWIGAQESKPGQSMLSSWVVRLRGIPPRHKVRR